MVWRGQIQEADVIECARLHHTLDGVGWNHHQRWIDLSCSSRNTFSKEFSVQLQETPLSIVPSFRPCLRPSFRSHQWFTGGRRSPSILLDRFLAVSVGTTRQHVLQTLLLLLPWIRAVEKRRNGSAGEKSDPDRNETLERKSSFAFQYEMTNRLCPEVLGLVKWSSMREILVHRRRWKKVFKRKWAWISMVQSCHFKINKLSLARDFCAVQLESFVDWTSTPSSWTWRTWREHWR